MDQRLGQACATFQNQLLMHGTNRESMTVLWDQKVPHRSPMTAVSDERIRSRSSRQGREEMTLPVKMVAAVTPCSGIP